jgi:hypothetical protein
MTLADFLDAALDIVAARWEWMLLGAILAKPLDLLLILAAVSVVTLEQRRGVR